MAVTKKAKKFWVHLPRNWIIWKTQGETGEECQGEDRAEVGFDHSLLCVKNCDAEEKLGSVYAVLRTAGEY